MKKRKAPNLIKVEKSDKKKENEGRTRHVIYGLPGHVSRVSGHWFLLFFYENVLDFTKHHYIGIFGITCFHSTTYFRILSSTLILSILLAIFKNFLKMAKFSTVE